MWRKVSAKLEESFLKEAILFTGNARRYGSFMRKVTELWPIACEHNLTDYGINRKAWLGHAATQMAIDCPEYITRMAWAHLTPDQQNKANLEAEITIDLWEAHYANNLTEQTCLRLI